MAFEQALQLEGGIPARFIALAKAYEKLGNRKGAIDALESAYELDNSTTTLRQILALHEASGDIEAIEATTARIEEQLAAIARQTRPRRTVTQKLKRPTRLRRVERPKKPEKPEKPRRGKLKTL